MAQSDGRFCGAPVRTAGCSWCRLRCACRHPSRASHTCFASETRNRVSRIRQAKTARDQRFRDRSSRCAQAIHAGAGRHGSEAKDKRFPGQHRLRGALQFARPAARYSGIDNSRALVWLPGKHRHGRNGSSEECRAPGCRDRGASNASAQSDLGCSCDCVVLDPLLWNWNVGGASGESSTGASGGCHTRAARYQRREHHHSVHECE